MRFLMRCLSLVALVGAILAGTVDAIASVAMSRAIFMPLGAVLAHAGLSPRGTETRQMGGLPEEALRFLLQQPAVGVFLSMALLAFLLGHRRRPAAGGFAA